MLDVIAVRDKVEQIHQEQLLNSAWRVAGGAELELIKQRENSIVHGQWMLNKRLCAFLISHGDGDAECSAMLWEDKENVLQHRGAH